MCRKTLVILILTSCGPLGRDIDGSYSCMMEGNKCDAEDNGTESEDGDGPYIVQGPVGPAGQAGNPGTMGPSGKTGAVGSTGNTGPQGISGIPGTPGSPGVGCTVTSTIGGAIVECGTTQVVILNGVAGADGQNAPPTPYTVTEVVDPCGDESGFDEVLLRLANGALLAHYASGAQQFLTSIGPGSYTTTDGHACNFVVHNDMSVTW